MDKKEYDWTIKLIQDREKYLGLTFNQAERIHEFENSSQVEPFFSAWEEFDYQLDFFKTFLDDNQFLKFEKEIKRRSRQVEKDLVDGDKFYIKQVKCNIEKLKYIENTFLPNLFKDAPFPVEMWLAAFRTYKTKIDFVKAGYDEYLQKTRKEILTNHYRFSRRLRPNELKNSLLLHEIVQRLPDYYSFKFWADEPTKVTIKFLVDTLSSHYKMAEAFIDKKFKSWADHSNKLWKKHVGESNGWQIHHGPSDNELFEHKLMTFLLMDSTKYGY